MTTIDIDAVKRNHGEETRQHRCRWCSEDFPCTSLRMAQEIERLTTPAEHDTNEREPISHAEFARFVQEAKEQRERAEKAEADVAFRKQQISELIDQRDSQAREIEHLTKERGSAVNERNAALQRYATAVSDAEAFRRQRDELVRLIDRKLMPAYFELCQKAGFGDVSQSEAVKAVDVLLAPYRETLERRTEPESARCPHGHAACCGHHTLEDIPIHTAGECARPTTEAQHVKIVSDRRGYHFEPADGEGAEPEGATP